jgi:SOS-response transcriptional repressor LexA
MPSIGQVIRAERERAGVTQESLAARLRISKSQLSLVESGKRSIDEARVARIEKILRISDGRLLAALRWDQTPALVRAELETLAERDQGSRALARKLRDAARSRAGRGKRKGASLDQLFKSGELRKWIEAHARNVDGPLPAGRRIPVINRVAAGYPREFTDLDYPASIADDYIACPDVADPDAFAARVVGDSMAPDYREGEIVVFSPMLPTPHGSDCFVRLERDHETTFKRVYFEEGGKKIRLQPINPAYPPRIVDREDVGGLYAAAYVMRKVCTLH